VQSEHCSHFADACCSQCGHAVDTAAMRISDDNVKRAMHEQQKPDRDSVSVRLTSVSACS